MAHRYEGAIYRRTEPPGLSKTAQAIDVAPGVPRSPGETNQIIDQLQHGLDGDVTYLPINLEFVNVRPHHRESGYPGIVYRRERVTRFVV